MKENIYEWLYYYRMKDEQAIPVLIEYFRPMVNSIAHKRLPDTSNQYMIMDDYYSLADSILIEVIDKYREDLSVKFEVLYYQCLQYRTIDLARSIFKRNSVYGDCIELDSKVSEESRYYMSDYVFDPSKLSTNTFVLEKDKVAHLMKMAKQELSKSDFLILIYRYQGYTIKEISNILKVTPQAVYYRMKIIRKWILLH